MNFNVLWLLMKNFSTKFGGVASFGSTSEQHTKVSQRKFIFKQFAKVFSLESFPLYGRKITLAYYRLPSREGSYLHHRCIRSSCTGLSNMYRYTPMTYTCMHQPSVFCPPPPSTTFALYYSLPPPTTSSATTQVQLLQQRS